MSAEGSNGRQQQKPFKRVSEAARERETFKYYSTLLKKVQVNSTGAPPDPSKLSSSSDVVLTTLAQAGVFQTGTDRSLVSLFDADYQYIVAEATSTTRLQPSVRGQDCGSSLWLCGTAIPRNHGVCELSLLGGIIATDVGSHEGERNVAQHELPLTLADDLHTDPRFCSKPFCQPGAPCRFYAAVPIRTRLGVNIGVYCVLSETPGEPWSDERTERLRDISRAIMDHLESTRMGDLHRRNQRMIRGFGSFVEGESTLSSWKSGPNLSAYAYKPELEGALNEKQQALGAQADSQPERSGEVTDPADSTPAVEDASGPRDPSPSAIHIEPTHGNAGSQAAAREALGRSGLDNAPADGTESSVMSKAANIIRESAEVEGCVFFDPVMQSPDSQPRSKPVAYTSRQSSGAASSSSDEGSEHVAARQELDYCQALGYSTSHSSSIDGDASKQLLKALPRKFLCKLLRRYPEGKIFRFTAGGELESSEDDHIPIHDPGQTGAGITPTTTTNDKPRKHPWARHREGHVILEAFPGAQSVAFSPIWDPRKDCWYAGSFVYTLNRSRTFTGDCELSYLRGFGKLAMAEIIRLSDLLAAKEKSNILGSISHELRSPLHGIILNSELLADTKLSVLQGDLAHTIEICSRTLLDTIDHLLDYSKAVRQPAKGLETPSSEARPLRGEIFTADETGHDPHSHLSYNCRVDGIVEDAIESVFAGHTFQRSLDKRSSLGSEADKADGHIDPTDSAVSVLLSIDPRCDWASFVQVGAIRRVMMNIFGNAIKYTERGTIRVSSSQEDVIIESHGGVKSKQRALRFTVHDTGKGIGRDFLQHKLYKPFSQEDGMSPGTGLGLSLVGRILKQLKGSISIDSEVGQGTTVSVVLPLPKVQKPKDNPKDNKAGSFSDEDKTFDKHIKDLKGLRVRLMLSDGHQDVDESGWQTAVADTCRNWLQMHVVSDASEAKSDITLWSHSAIAGMAEDVDTPTSTPNVVICSDTLVAIRQSKMMRAANHAAVCEFISQPAGPRKLARAIVLAYTRWMQRPSSSSAPLTGQGNGIARVLSPFASSQARRPPLNRAASSGFSLSAETSESAEDGASDWWCDPARSDSGGSQTSAHLSTPQAGTPEPPGRFLLVDDNSINLKMLAMYMTKLSIEFDTAANGKEAVDLFCVCPGRYACVLMDISMPVMDGFEATRCIRAYENAEKCPFTPIIALSGLASESAHEEAKRSGMDLFLTKPVKLKALGSVLESMGL